MAVQEVLMLVFVVLVHIDAVASALFVVLYFRSPWRDTGGGRALMVSEAGLAVYLAYVIVNYWTHFVRDGTTTGEWIAIAIALIVGSGRFYLLVVLTVIQREEPGLTRWPWRWDNWRRKGKDRELR